MQDTVVTTFTAPVIKYFLLKYTQQNEQRTVRLDVMAGYLYKLRGVNSGAPRNGRQIVGNDSLSTYPLLPLVGLVTVGEVPGMEPGASQTVL